MKKIVCVGSATVDILVRSDDLKVMKSHQVTGGVAICEVYGGKSEAEEIFWEVGGSAVNVATGLTRLGNVCSVIARIGEDISGERVLEGLKLEGIDISQIQGSEKLATAMSVILIATDGGRSIITSRRASAQIESGKIDWGKVAGADWIQIGSLGGNVSLLNDLISFARNKNIGIGWNPGKGELMRSDVMARMLPKVDLLVLNKMEAAQFLRHPYEQIKEMAHKLAKMGVDKVAITDGRRGAGIAANGIWIFAPALKTTVVDETGAGDAFVVGLVAGIMENKDLDICLKMGLANGASQVTATGARAGLLRKREMTKWLRRRTKMVEEKLE